MKTILVLGVLAITFALRAQQSDDIPTVTLPQIGAGPALLLFVSDYTDAFPPLPGVLKDKPAILSTVKQLGFTDVTVLENPAKEAMKTAMSDFGRAAAKSPKASFFYFSGHGVLNNRLNYLIPANAPIETQGHLDLYAVPAEHVTGFVAGKKSAGPCLFFVDACRNNELPADEKSSEGDGVAFQRQAGMFIGYATDEGKTSGLTDQGSFFTASLAKRLLTPGRSLDDVFAGVVADVEAAPLREKQPPQKESRLRYVLHLVPDDGDELARLRRENEALKRGTPMVPGSAAVPSGSAVPQTPPVDGGAPGSSILDQGSIGKVIQIKLPGGQVMKFAYCSPGSFTMGSPASEEERGSDEDQVEVTLTKGFWMAQTECTQAQWQAVMGTSLQEQAKLGTYGKDLCGAGAELPMYFVSHDEATSFCETVQGSVTLPAGWKVALPSEAQWEYACRAGTTGAYAGTLDKVAWYSDNSDDTTHAVGSKQANAWDLYDMHGNVREWCADGYDGYDTKLPGGTDPRGATTGALRVNRGGAWIHDAALCRAALRFRNEPGFRVYYLGFRPALVPSR
jgi:sulfatase modifying factor 1